MSSFSKKILTATLFASAAFGISPSIFAQATADTSFWIGPGGLGGSGNWNTAANWNIATSGNPSLPPQAQSNTQIKNVLFSNSTGSVVSINMNVGPNQATSLGFTSGWGDMIVREGVFAFNLNGRNFTFADLVLGDGATVGTAQFSSATNATLSIGDIKLQSNGGNYQLASLLTNLNGNVGSNIIFERRGGLKIGGENTGINNTVYLGLGESASTGDITLNASNTSGSNNNMLEVDGGSLSAGQVLVGGYYNASDPGNLISANNQLFIHNGGQVTASSGAQSLIGIEAGSLLRLETGGKLILNETSGFGLQRDLNIAEHGQLILNGAGSQISATAAAGYKLNVAGSAEVTDGASLGNLGVLSVASTGYALVKDTTLSSGALEVSGIAEFKNADFTNVGNISVNGGHLLVDEGSRLDSNGSTGTLQVSAGGTMDIKNNSEVRTYYLFGSGAGITVEQGSTLYFDKWTTGRLSVQGTAIWGTGEKNGPHPTQDDSHLEATISAGTTLLLGGGSYDLDGEQKIGSGSTATRISRAGKFTVESGGVLGGSGHIGNNPNFTGSGPDNQTFVEVRGGSLQPGTNNAAGALYFHDGVSFLENPSSITFSVFNTSEYDQILTSSITVAIGVTIKLELTQDFLAFLDDLSVLGPEEMALFFASSDPFQFIGNLDGLARLVPGSFVFDYGTSAGQLAEYGLGWDVSNFAGTGAVGITAVPEPGVSVLAGIGLAVVLWSRSRRRNPVAA